jgi:hypothetical protein
MALDDTGVAVTPVGVVGGVRSTEPATGAGFDERSATALTKVS